MVWKARPGANGTGCKEGKKNTNWCIWCWTPDFPCAKLGGDDTTLEGAGPGLERSGSGWHWPTAGRASVLEPLAFVPPSGGGLELAQCGRSAQGHGGTKFIAQVAATGPAPVARTPTGSRQPDAVRAAGPKPMAAGTAGRAAGHGAAVDGARGQRRPKGTKALCGGPAPVPLSGPRRDGRGEPAISGQRWPGAPAGFAALWLGGLAMPAAGSLHWLGASPARAPLGTAHQQYSLCHPALGEGAAFGQLDFGPSDPAALARLASQVRTPHCVSRNVRGAATLCRHCLSGGGLAVPWANH